ncbi:hypothetical protein QMZ92_33940 [Streptomyces sp. HNM0645]|uniref:hypothetical protein n=1 Tax=Streptomyces sp. HNM0645 TaxID=2782343 RepID=UPI0024B7E495|nr:hypothetical protein [Streptomyces sp. HNM0645]MDI9889202.1 hypothetical protein [Streptomyces sp. HNM0645]
MLEGSAVVGRTRSSARTAARSSAAAGSTGLATRFAEAPDRDARLLVLRAPDATPELVECLSHDPDARVRSVTGHNQRLPVRRLMEMLADPEAGWSAAANPLLPVKEIWALRDRTGIPDSRQLRPPSAQPMVTTRAQDGGASGT